MPGPRILPTNHKILIYDLETAPLEGWFWKIWKENIGLNQIKNPGRVLCWCAKWLGEDEVIYASEWEHGHKEMILSLHSLIEEADAIVAHFGNKFDRPTMNMEFLRYDLKPPAPNKQIDTYLVARSTFRLLSNKLDYLGEFLGLGRKLPTSFQLWLDCIAGDPEAQEKMIEYNIQDVILLEQVYLKLRPWIRNHPNMSLLSEDPVCPNCGSPRLQRRGFSYTQVSKFQRFQCQECGAWSRTRTTELDAETRKSILTQDKTT